MGARSMGRKMRWLLITFLILSSLCCLSRSYTPGKVRVRNTSLRASNVAGRGKSAAAGMSTSPKSIKVPNILKKFKEGTLNDASEEKGGATSSPADASRAVEAVTGGGLEVADEAAPDAAVSPPPQQTVSSKYQESIESIVMSAVEQTRASMAVDAGADGDGDEEQQSKEEGGLSLYVHSMSWVGNRLEVVLSSVDTTMTLHGGDELPLPEGPPLGAIQRVHKAAYAALELREEELRFTEAFELVVASPGVRDELRSDRDFQSFRGFPVTVTTTEAFRKKTVFEGTLLDRDCEHVRVSTKGRITKIPRALVAGVALPKSKFEPTDLEIRGKLR